VKRTLRAAAAVVVSLGLVGAAVPATGVADVGVLTIGSTGCCKN
jgi:nitrogenase molybdenum-iron protein alpha/beta subunit